MTNDAWRTSSTEVLEHDLTMMAAKLAAITCRFLQVIAELDRREAWAGCTSMAQWLSWRCSLSPSAAREHVRVAHALEKLPLTTEAFARGELSYSKVRALVRVATPHREAELVELARTGTAAQLERMVRATIVATTDPMKREAQRELHTGIDLEAMGTLRARMRPEERELLDTAIAAAMKSMPVDDDSAESSSAARRLDALMRICESYLAHGDEQRDGPARHSVVIHVEVDETGIVEAETASGAPLHPDTAERLSCDSTRQTIIHGKLMPLATTQASRQPNRALRRWLHKRSGGTCEFAGCDARQYVEVHHVNPVEKGGPTVWWNLAMLCWHHHHLVHEGGYRFECDRAAGVLRCYRPDGALLEATIPISIDPELALEVDVEPEEDAIVPLWSGERFDPSACVDAMLAFTGRT